MNLLIELHLVVFSILLLWKGADWLVESSCRIAHQLGISDLVIGLTVVAIGTSAPEFAVTINAALTGSGDISVSNVVGSNIFNLGFILGGTACFHAISTTPKLVWRDGIFLILVTVILTMFMFQINFETWSIEWQGMIGKGEGIFLILLLVGYISFLLIKKEAVDEEIPQGKATWFDWVLLVVGIAVVVDGGHLLVESASNVAREFGVSEWTIGVTIVAAGTSAPEFATATMAIVKKRHGLAIGNLIGSDLFNLLGVLGVAALIHPDVLLVGIEAKNSMFLLVSMVALVVIFMRSGWKLSRLEGGILVGINLVRWIYDFTGSA